MERMLNPPYPDPATSPSLRVLVVEDSEDDYQLLLAQLSAAGYRITSRLVEDMRGMREALQEPWDIVVSDHNMPRFTSTAALQLLKETLGEVPFLIVSAAIGEEVAVEALHAGASDYIMKDNLRRLAPAVERALAAAKSERARRLAELALKESETRFRAITSNLPGMVFQLHYAGQDNAVYFSYVSEGALALFGVPARSILHDPQLFLDRIRREDRDELERMFVDGATALCVLRWEGRLADAGEARWISISASPRELGPGLVWWEGIASDVTREKRAELEIRESREQLRQLSTHVERVKESERSRIAREIHDDIGGTLTAVKLDLAWLGGKLGENEPLTEKIRALQQHLDSALRSSIRIARDLRPSLLDYGIVPAIEWQLGDFRNRMGITCELDCPHEDIDLNPDLATAVFRIFQEALTNIAKHANASTVNVKFAVTDRTVALQVRDNGVGLENGALAKPDSFGLRGMRERVAELRGTLQISGSADTGTTLVLDLPRHTEQAGSPS
jgi:two-component system, NarL family, sensor histidine kinase UhpB